MITVESLPMLGPLNSMELVVVELDVVVVVAGGAVVAGGKDAVVEVLVAPASPDPPLPHAVATRIRARAKKMARLIGQ